ncbi:MAG: YbbR-like domain-containing protein [Deltaproteobacteria bacterium]|nr:YbbR-like domain-containing protein [Deltaproteobacteria bacterium]
MRRLGNHGTLYFSESLALKAVSLLLALILWITILGFKREELKKNVKFEPLLAPGMMITSKIPNHIQFTLSGPRVLLKDAEKKIQPIRPDLRHTRESTIPITISDDYLGELPMGVRVVSFYPPNLIVRVEEVLEKYVPVKPTIKGTPASGYELAIIRAEPNRVAVSGPKSFLETLDSVGTEPVDLTDIKGSKELVVGVEVDASQGYRLSRDRTVRVRVITKRVSKKRG